MSNKPTKGPWVADFKSIGHVKADNGALIAQCKRLTTLTNMEANARLIAEAGTVYHETGKTPRELLEILQSILKADESDTACGGEMYYAEVIGDAVRDARAALSAERKTT